MSIDLPSRVASHDRECGAFAVLYAALVVVCIAMGAIVVDIAALREDRRDNRSAADSAVVGAAEFLNETAVTGRQPYEACVRAWDYLTSSLKGLTRPSGACAPFLPTNVNPVTYCATSSPALIRDEHAVGKRIVVVAWPVPRNASEGFLTAELAPGAAAQTFSPEADGSDEGCDRIGVAIFQDRQFGLAGAFGMTGTRTQVHSVARSLVEEGPPNAVAALNILEPKECETLDTGGQGTIIVNRGSATAPGIIAVESSGVDCPTNNTNSFVLDVSNNVNNRVCASGPAQTPDLSGTCDGKGTIQQHALDPGGNKARSYPWYPNVPPANTLAPKPTAEGGQFGWLPVTDVYGCRDLDPCQTPDAKNHIDKLVTALDRDDPVPYVGSGSYAGTSFGSFTTIPSAALPSFSCSPATNLYIPPGNWYVNCPDSGQTVGFRTGANDVNVVFGGGTIVFAGGVQVAKQNSCLAINVPVGDTGVATCPATTDDTGVDRRYARTVVSPLQDAQVFIRGNLGLSTGSSGTSLIMPQTFVYQKGNGLLALGGGSGKTLWTAPGAGQLISGVRQLESLCTLGGAPDQSCLDSHFRGLNYWSEKATSTSGQGDEHLIGGQGGLSLVGVFFTPRQKFTFAGQGAFSSTNAQFWSDKLLMSGQGTLALTPDPDLSVKRPTARAVLIR